MRSPAFKLLDATSLWVSEEAPSVTFNFLGLPVLQDIYHALVIHQSHGPVGYQENIIQLFDCNGHCGGHTGLDACIWIGQYDSHGKVDRPLDNITRLGYFDNFSV